MPWLMDIPQSQMGLKYDFNIYLFFIQSEKFEAILTYNILFPCYAVENLPHQLR